MHVIKRFGWEIPAARITPEPVVLRRRAILAGSAAVGTVALGTFRSLPARAEEAPARNPAFDPGRAITDEKYATTYNNYYEYGESKNIWRAAQVLKQRPWTIEIGGMVSQPRTIAIDDLLKQVQLEERVYRHRCVEAWAMTVPWTGFQLSQLVKLADPLGSAKYVVFETAQDKTMTGLNAPFYPWPYIEGVTMDEAANELAFISTGMYGKPLPPQNGGPLRLTLPWKYGFKSAKAIAKVTFTDKRPTTFWEAIQPSEYGFWANVNPAVPHPRWSQAKERLLGDDEMVPTQLYNGYASFVAGLYTDRKGEKLFM
ncbi:MAG: protein-methionine-sulfoxide reductase catalytic subunit MsrP [Rhodospirillales bacterium]|nr:protein-methionine-sulfoxide reductase catalytic subunit MsrP [Rhodospirillales bacterium]